MILDAIWEWALTSFTVEEGKKPWRMNVQNAD